MSVGRGPCLLAMVVVCTSRLFCWNEEASTSVTHLENLRTHFETLRAIADGHTASAPSPTY